MKLALCLAFVCTTAFAQEEQLSLQLPQHIVKQCEEAGGCTLVTKRQADEAMKAVFAQGFRTGQIAQALASAEVQTAQGCERKSL